MMRIACLQVPGADAAVQSALLDIALRHSPSVEDVAPGIVLLDLRGLGKLWGGEEELARRLREAVAERGWAARVGIAGSRAGARFAARAGDGVTIVPPGRDARRLGVAPLALLDLGPEMTARLARWGIRTLGELADLPARGLAQRLGDEGPRLQRLARGEDPTPLRLWAPPPVFEESAECAWGIEALEPLGDLMAGLAEVLCARLRRDELTADRFEWVCRLANRTVHEGVCAPAAPLADPAAAAAMLRASLAARPPRAAVEGITLRAHPLRAPKAQPRFDEPPRPSPRLLTAALARLSGLVGASAIGSPELLDSHRPDAIQMTPFLLPSPQCREGVRNQIPLPHRGRGQGEGAVLAVRRMRPPRPAQVTLESGAPTHLRVTGLTGRIVAGAGPWRVSGEWWREDAFVQDEWDVELGDGTLCRLARDGRGWRLEAIYD
ncbi:MAG TPA: DNA polymerase Y family protein [Methylomirabilota bacterium]|jgi:protein ImuB|nr:DNA polymerase Y family protein [Methylomirabilota bacterium]